MNKLTLCILGSSLVTSGLWSWGLGWLPKELMLPLGAASLAFIVVIIAETFDALDS